MTRLSGLLCLLISFTANAQYYYKDLVVSRQTMEQMRRYKEQKIRNVSVTSYESNGERTEDFFGSQTLADNYTRINTMFKTAISGESGLTTFFDSKGNLVKTIDTTDGAGSVSEYFYNENGMPVKIVNISTSAGDHKEKEEHNWFYNSDGQPEKMLRIKNDSDTAYIDFVTDENGNVAEENSRRKGVALTSFYYYHDNKNRLTDIVSYSQKAKRLLPLYIFEYKEGVMPSSMLIVPEGSDDYQKWYYEYNDRGLKIRETCFNKRKQLLGKIEFGYN